MSNLISLTKIYIVCCFLLSSCAVPQPQKPTLTPKPEQTSSPTNTPLPPQAFPVKLAWFYKAPISEDYALVASQYDFFILSKGNEDDRNKLLALGAHRPILEYIRFDAIMDPGSCSRDPWKNNAAFMPGDFCNISTQHPDWFLLDKNGERYVDPYGGEEFVRMDPGNPGWRAFFLERVRQTLDNDRNWDGIFMDNVEVTMYNLERESSLPTAYQDEASYQAAVQGFLSYLSLNYFKPSGRLLFANIVSRKDDANWVEYISALDGVMHEGWSIDWPNRYRPADVWEKQLTLAEDTQALGKYILLISQGTQPDQELEQFAFASYLLVNQGRAVFRYANSQNYKEIWLYDNYSTDLGKALGPRFREGDAWRRNFSNGYVLVNPTTHESQIKIGN
ncbi:MAG: putative glycoside hydrolase [Chloroflexota bacterium]